MSLTRAEWYEMWGACERIEHKILMSLPVYRTEALLKDVQLIKDKIQSVIGQKE